MQDLLAGHVPMAFDGLGTSGPQIAAGKLRGLAITAQKRVPALPDVPTSAEAGLPGFEFSTWYGILAKKGTPQEAIDRMIKEVKAAMALPMIVAAWERNGSVVPDISGAEYAKVVSADVARWRKVVTDAGIKLDIEIRRERPRPSIGHRSPHPRTAPLVIRRVDAIPVALPLKSPMKMAAETITAAQNLLVRIEAADGTVGWGEAASAPTMTGDTQGGLVAAVRDHLAPLLVGKDARDWPALRKTMHRALVGNGGAHSAVEMALLDLIGRATGQAPDRPDRQAAPQRGETDVAARQSDRRSGRRGGSRQASRKASTSSSSRSA